LCERAQYDGNFGRHIFSVGSTFKAAAQRLAAEQTRTESNQANDTWNCSGMLKLFFIFAFQYARKILPSLIDT
jgi:hypothetical protein